MRTHDPWITRYLGVGMSSETEWRIGQVLSTAFQKQVGFKGTYLVALVIYVAVSIVAGFISESLFGPSDEFTWAGFWGELVITLAMLPLGVGLGLLGIRRAAQRDVPLATLIEPYNKSLQLMAMLLIMMLLIVAGYALFILPGIYLSIAYAFAPYLITEKDMGVWEALETSRKAITQFWWRYFGLMLVGMLMIIVGSIPLLVGLLWALPILAIATGEVFADTFGEDAPREELPIDDEENTP